MPKPNIVVLTGAGISAESGLKTFRDSDGLWENYRIEDVATPEAWRKNPQLVLDFYNHRRRQAFSAEPNAAHRALAFLETHFNVQIVTQNVDSLHEKAGSSNVLHLHGELAKVRSVKNEKLIYDYADRPVQLGDTAEDGGQLRPHIVWFGEAVPLMETAIDLAAQADIFLVVGTSLQVYPAAGLLHYTPADTPIFMVDPNAPNDVTAGPRQITYLNEMAGTGVPKLVNHFIHQFS